MLRVLLSLSRLYFLLVFGVFLLILYLLHHHRSLTLRPPPTSRLLPNYQHKFQLQQVQRLTTHATRKKEAFHDVFVRHDKKNPDTAIPARTEPATVTPDDNVIFYIDPPDKPVPKPQPKPSLVRDFLKNAVSGGDIFNPDSNDLTDNIIARHQQSQASPDQGPVNKPGGSLPKPPSWLPPISDHGNTQEQESKVLVEQWQKLREEQHKLLEDKIRWQKEQGVVAQTVDQTALLYRRHLPPTDPAHWAGLNSSQVELRYPGLLFSRDYRPRNFIDLHDDLAAGMDRRPRSLDNMTDGQAEDRFYQLMTMTHLDCGNIKRLGNTEDGGWDVCVVEPYTPLQGCLVYSFGINFDFTFDDGLTENFGCQIRTFDPSMQVGDHMHLPTVYFYQLGLGASNTVNSKGWRLETLGNIIRKLGHQNRTIDLLKLDVEFSEWSCLQTALSDGSLTNVKQLAFEAHTPEVYTVGRPSRKHDYADMYSVLSGLEAHGFRKYHFTYNPLGKFTSVRTGKPRSCCYELYYVNINYLKL